MGSYAGGKIMIGKQIADTIHSLADGKEYKGYCEPFCGFCGVYRHISLGDNFEYLAVA